MGQELGERYSQQQEKKRHRHTILAFIGLFLLILSLGSFGASIYMRSTSLATLTRGVPSWVGSLGIGAGNGPCFTVSPKILNFTILQRQGNQTAQMVTLTPTGKCAPTDTWSAVIKTSQEAHWFSISPIQGNLSRTQVISVVVSSSALTKGIYTGVVDFPDESSASIQVIANVVQDQQQSLLDDIVAYTHIGNLVLMAEWPAQLVKGQSANITISLLSSRNLPHHLPRAMQSKNSPGVPALGVAGADTSWLLGDVGWQLEGNGPRPTHISLTSQLYGVAFNISPSIPLLQTPNQRIVSFHWNILPKEAGPQDITVSIVAQWPHESSGELEEDSFLMGEFAVNVNESPQPFFTLGQITISELLSGLLGSALSIPWIVDYIQKKKEAKGKEKKHPHPTSANSQNTSAHPTNKPKKRSNKGSRRRN